MTVTVRLALLPQNATPIQTALSRTGAAILDIDLTPIRDAARAYSCPIALLPWLAWERSVDFWRSEWPDVIKRFVVFGSFRYHQIKATPAAVEFALEMTGYAGSQVVEWFEYGGSPHRFRVNLNRPAGGPMEEAEYLQVVGTIRQAKRKSQKLEALSITVAATAPAPRIAAYYPAQLVTVILG